MSAQDEATDNTVAGTIINIGEEDPLYVVVSSDDDEMSAIDLIREAGLPLVTVEFGGLGEGVCEIIDRGCDVSACRQRVCQTGDPDSPFWQFWVQDDDGQWVLSPLGGSHHQIEDGDITAWVWSGTQPDLEPLTWAELANRAGAPQRVIDRDASPQEGVWSSDVFQPGGGADPSMTGMVGSTVVIMLVAAAGFLLARRRRHTGLFG